MVGLFIDLMERGLLPDALVRFGVRHLCGSRLRTLRREQESNAIANERYARDLRKAPLAVATKDANAQHYEVPSEFFSLVLGPARKYSCAYWPENCATLDTAEKIALEETMKRAEIADGMSILELGCGWGSLTLAMAERFPKSRIVAISNSSTQRAYIQEQLAARGFKNVEVKTLDLSSEQAGQALEGQVFDRVVSVEMFEHFKNYDLLLKRVAHWLKPQGKLFVHIFTHEAFSYPFETEGEDNWMGRYFFTGGQMPSKNLLGFFQDELKLDRQWSWEGTHYQKTAEAWLQNMDQQRARIHDIFETTYGKAEAARWVERWRVFFISCAELFGFKEGSEWGVTHYLFTKPGTPP